jgi:phosphoserine phosphatase RsbU/P
VTPDVDPLLADTAEELFEEAPCGYLTTRLDGTIVQVNRTFERWTGHGRSELLGARRLQDLLAPGARIYFETHYSPLLQMQGSVREVAMEIVRADGSRLPALMNSTLRRDADGRPGAIRTMVFDASDRRRYEQELLHSRQQEQEIALELQRSLLSGELPVADGFTLEVTYRPAVSGLEVGGDWYDAFWLDRDARVVGLVVGDVVGRGIEAAATMGQLRSAVRALASTGLGPAALLSALDAYAVRHSVGRMATLVYAELDLGSRSFCYSCAGHPPPLVFGAGVAPSYAWGGRSLPLDAFAPDGLVRQQDRLELPPDGGVMLYTDGLIERPPRPLLESMDLLLDEVGRRHGTPGAPLAEPVVRAFHERDHSDDICVVTARVSP